MNPPATVAAPGPSAPTATERLLVVLGMCFFGVVLLRTAWVCDDAYITFRTIDNLVHGYGLTWNVAERVQAYTHPLWMLLLAFAYAFTREIYTTSIFLSLLLSFGTVGVLWRHVARSNAQVLLAVVILTSSKAFTDYSTSGLENPLTHLLCALFLAVYLREETGKRKLLLLTLIAALAMLNRMDTALLFLPTLGVVWWSSRDKGWRSWLPAVALGFSPFVVWELFSLFYYGSFVPNTAYAKLNTGINTLESVRQGINYLLASVLWDPLTPVVIVLGWSVPFLHKDWRMLPVVLGAVAYVLYTVKIGGDFMSGRFLTPPFLCSVALLCQGDFRFEEPVLGITLGAVLLLALAAPFPSLTSDARYGEWSEAARMDGTGVADERAWYYPTTGLLRSRRNGMPISHSWVLEGATARRRGLKVVVEGEIGFYGYHAGPQVHIVDPHALAEPLLARLPADRTNGWRIGHFVRTVPEGYLETLETGRNVIRDPNVAAFYDKLALVTRAPLFSAERLREVWKLNTGAYAHLLPK